MPNVKISALPAVTVPALTDSFPVVQGGVTKQETVSQLGQAVGAFTSIVNVSSAQMLALHTTAIELIPAPGANLVIVPLHLIIQVTSGSTGYTGVVKTGTTDSDFSPVILYGTTLGANQRSVFIRTGSVPLTDRGADIFSTGGFFGIVPTSKLFKITYNSLSTTYFRWDNNAGNSVNNAFTTTVITDITNQPVQIRSATALTVGDLAFRFHWQYMVINVA